MVPGKLILKQGLNWQSMNHDLWIDFDFWWITLSNACEICESKLYIY